MHIACVHCTTINRVPDERSDQDPVCGKCGRPLLGGEPVELTDENFDAVVAKTELPVLVDFWAPWCGPCRMMAPQFAQAAAAAKGRALFVKVNTDENPALSVRYRIRSIPTLMLFKQGSEADRRSGAMGAQDLLRWAGV